ncbi:MAG: CDP-archaeol synthase [Candidatus Heimdallarchaeota archaeon]|nr:CDP-archaeol synthase [Candidatus Heimdallarchaeota archaeon]
MAQTFSFFLFVGYALLYGLPIYMCNSFANLSKFIPFLGSPVDFNKNWKDGRRVFGDHKTWRGIIFGIIAGTVTGVLIWYFCFFKYNLLEIDDKFLSLGTSTTGYPVYPWYVGFFMSIGDHAADLAGSFIKRRMNIPSGGALPLYDQGSWVVTGILLALPFTWGAYYLWFYIVTLIIITPVIHFIVNIAAYWLKLKDVWY